MHYRWMKKASWLGFGPKLFDTLSWAEILVKTTFLGTSTLTVPNGNKRKEGNNRVC
jgi:hypothetical protein